MNGDWISTHVFYSSNANPMLAECIMPLTDKLREQNLIARYFFIRYWLGGPHIRLRLKRQEKVSEQEIKSLVEPSIHAFLARRPALFELDRKAIGPLYKKMFEAEYGAEAFVSKYGENGEIPFYPNNSLYYIEYEPELTRYGGECGVDFAEKHFEVSSDIILKLVRDTNIHVRSIMLGHSIQLMLQMCYGLLADDEKIGDFFARYIEFWQQAYNERSHRMYPGFDRKYAHMATKLQDRISEIRRFIAEGDSAKGTEIERQWAEHVRSIRKGLQELVITKRLQMPNGLEGEDAAIRFLLPSYIHMTNNRLGVSILDEIYLSYLIQRAIAGSSTQEVEEGYVRNT